MSPSFMSILAIQSERLRPMQERFSQPDPGAAGKMIILLVLLAVAVLLIGLLGYLQRKKNEPAKPQPIRLYFQLCAALNISWYDRLRLWWLARRLQIEHPAALLISSSLFDHTVEQHSGMRHSPRFHALRQQIFG